MASSFNKISTKDILHDEFPRDKSNFYVYHSYSFIVLIYPNPPLGWIRYKVIFLSGV